MSLSKKIGNMAEEIQNEGTPTCPYCYEDEPDGWELVDESKNIECSYCGKEYRYHTDIVRYFYTEKLPESCQ